MSNDVLFKGGLRPASQFLIPGQGLPSIQPQQAHPGHFPNSGAFDPRSSQPGYQPGNNSDPYTGHCWLSLGATNQSEISFSPALFAKPGTGQRPEPMTLTLIPNTQTLRELGAAGAATGAKLDLYYKIQYIFDAQYPAYVDGRFNEAQAPSGADNTPILATAPTRAGYKLLQACGIRQQVAGWAFKVWVTAVGRLNNETAGGLLANWQALGTGGTPINLRFDAFLSPGAWAPLNDEPYQIGNPDDYLVTFARKAKFPTVNGVVGSTFTFLDISENSIVTYPFGSDAVTVPARAVKLTSAAVLAFGEIQKY